MKTILFILLGVASLVACAQSPAPGAVAKAESTMDGTKSVLPAGAPGTPAAHARDALRKINPEAKIEMIQDAPMPGFQQAIVGGQVVYVSNDGKYMLPGALYDMRTQRDLSATAMANLRTKLLRKVPLDDRIVFAPANPRYTVVVFTDVECGFCRKFHSQIADYNRQGIAVQYLAFPRLGLGSQDFKKMVAVWCAADPRQALTDAKHDRAVPYRNCNNPVTMEYSLGQRLGLTGTPMILASDGTELGGYLPPETLRAMLDKLAADDFDATGNRATSDL